MKPIISPWFIYLISRIDAFKEFLSIITFIFIIYTFISFLDWGDEEKDDSKVAKLIKRNLMIFAILLFLNGAIPDSKTTLAMYTTKFITPNNIQIMKGEVKETIDYIFEKVDEIIQKTHDDK